jgi:hypothetical protein
MFSRLVYGLLITIICIGFTCYLFGLILIAPLLLLIKSSAKPAVPARSMMFLK